jgi:predicted nuclease of predicted toxin-antitoxin system
MKLLLDMNLSPDWIPVLQGHGWEAVHGSTVGDPRATDRVIMDWARTNEHVVFTHDLDFGAMLVATQAIGPSVIQVRTQDVSPGHLETIIVGVLGQHKSALEGGALVVVDEVRSRVRILPLVP